MAQEFTEYLRSLGATDDDLKVMDTPIARKAFDDLQTRQSAADTLLTQNKEWHTKAKSEYDRMQRENVESRARAAQLEEGIRASGDEALIELAKKAGHEPAPKNDLPAGFDPAKYMTVDALRDLSEGVGDGLATMQDMVAEHMQLFPKQPLRMRDLRREATAAGKTVEQYWMEKYKVPEARATQAATVQKEHDDAIRKEARDATVAELATKYGNPDMRPMAPSRSVFASRQSDGTVEGKQPWERDGDNREKRHLQRSDEAIKRVLGPAVN